jgi:hypothetical protein
MPALMSPIERITTMKNGQMHNLQELAAELERRAAAKRDLIVPTPKLQFAIGADGLQLEVDGQEELAVNDLAHRQIGEHAGIPAVYYDKMRKEAPDLLADNVNRWFRDEPANRLVRTMEGTVRAFLSDKYKPIENEDMARATLPALLELDLDIMSSEITERRFYIKAVDKKVTRELAKIGGNFGDGKHVILRTVSPALTISNSEVGFGAASVLGGVYDAFCSNLASFGERSVRKYHVGGRNEIGADETYAVLSDETKKLTDQATLAQMADVVKAAFDRARFDSLVAKIEGTQADKIEGDPVKVVSFAAKRFGLNETEGKDVLRHLIEGASLTRFGLYNAITRASQDVPDYDRASELERTGGKIIELPESDWRVIGMAA